jgi:hypothetical protein
MQEPITDSDEPEVPARAFVSSWLRATCRRPDHHCLDVIKLALQADPTTYALRTGYAAEQQFTGEEPQTHPTSRVTDYCTTMGGSGAKLDATLIHRLFRRALAGPVYGELALLALGICQIERSALPELGRPVWRIGTSWTRAARSWRITSLQFRRGEAKQG